MLRVPMGWEGLSCYCEILFLVYRNVGEFKANLPPICSGRARTELSVALHLVPAVAIGILLVWACILFSLRLGVAALHLFILVKQQFDEGPLWKPVPCYLK